MPIQLKKRHVIGYARWSDRIARTTRDVITGLRAVGQDEDGLQAATLAIARESLAGAGDLCRTHDAMLFRRRDGVWEMVDSVMAFDPDRHSGKFAAGLFRLAHAIEMELRVDEMAAESFMSIVQRTIETDLGTCSRTVGG